MDINNEESQEKWEGYSAVEGICNKCDYTYYAIQESWNDKTLRTVLFNCPGCGAEDQPALWGEMLKLQEISEHFMTQFDKLLSDFNIDAKCKIVFALETGDYYEAGDESVVFPD